MRFVWLALMASVYATQHPLTRQATVPIDRNESDVSQPGESDEVAVRVAGSVFHVQGRASSLVLAVDGEGEVRQLHYGRRVAAQDDAWYAARVEDEAVAFDAGARNSVLRAMADAGTGDYRIPGYRVAFPADGSSVSPVRFASYAVAPGKDTPPAFPHFWSAAPHDSSSLTLRLTDPLTNLTMLLHYTAFPEYDAITRSVEVVNEGDGVIIIEELNSLQMDFPAASHDAPYHWTQLSGSWARERQVVTRTLEYGITAIESRRGATGHQHNPFVVISEGPPHEDHGNHYGFALVYDSSFQAKFELTQSGTGRLVMGLHPDTFQWHLAPGESFRSPEAVMVFSSNGLGDMSRKFHRLIRNHLLPQEWRYRPRPILVNSWEAMYFDCSEKHIMERLAYPAASLGIDMVVLDDGWFGNRRDDKRALGDWTPNSIRFPHGLDGLKLKLNQTGIKYFGIWMEPEMISVDSELYRTHPEWCVHTPDRSRTESRNQLVLDLSRDDVQQFVIDSVIGTLRASKADYLKWDFNRHLTEMYSVKLPPHLQGQFLHRWMQGLYKILQSIREAFPNVLIESCSGGGGRFDLATFYFTPMGWTSDNTDAISRTRIQWGTSYLFPPNVMASHVSAVPNHQTLRSTPFWTRHVVALSGMLGYELSLDTLSEDDKTIIQHATSFFRSIEPILKEGDMYRLHSPFSLPTVPNAPVVSSWMVVSQDQSEAVVYVILSSYHDVVVRPGRIRLKGLDQNSDYVVRVKGVIGHMKEREYENGLRVSGETLMGLGLVVKMERDADSVLFHVRRE